MSLVGILTENKNESHLNQAVKGIIPQNQIFYLKENTIKNLRNIKFETILIGKKITRNKKVIKEMAQKADYIIFNTDIIENLNLLEDLNLKLITYGFNPKATITTSSLENSKIMVCLQRAIKNLQGEIIEPQEWNKKLLEDLDGYTAMEIVALLLLYDNKKLT